MSSDHALAQRRDSGSRDVHGPAPVSERGGLPRSQTSQNQRHDGPPIFSPERLPRERFSPKTGCSRSNLAGECRWSPIPADRVLFSWQTAIPRNLPFGTCRTLAAQIAAAPAAQRLLPIGTNWHCRPGPDIRRASFTAEKPSFQATVRVQKDVRQSARPTHAEHLHASRLRRRLRPSDACPHASVGQRAQQLRYRIGPGGPGIP